MQGLRGEIESSSMFSIHKIGVICAKLSNSAILSPDMSHKLSPTHSEAIPVIDELRKHEKQKTGSVLYERRRRRS